MKTCYVLMAGLPGVGKTTLATALAEATAGAVLSKDAVRAALFPGALTDYSDAQDDLCFAAVLESAAYLAHHRRVPFVFLDGRTFRTRGQVETAIEAAEAAGCDWRILLLTAPDDVALARIARGQHVAGNRDADLYFKTKQTFEPIEREKLHVDSSLSLAACVERCLRYLNGG